MYEPLWVPPLLESFGKGISDHGLNQNDPYAYKEFGVSLSERTVLSGGFHELSSDDPGIKTSKAQENED